VFLHLSVASAEDACGSWEEYLLDQARAYFSAARATALSQLIVNRDAEFAQGHGTEEYPRFIRFVETLESEEFAPYLLFELIDAGLQLKALRLDEDRMEDERWRATCREVSMSGELILEACGSESSPRWVLYAAGSMKTGTFLNGVVDDAQFIEKFQMLREQLSDGLVTIDEALGSMPNTLMAHLWDQAPAADDLFLHAAAHTALPSEDWPAWASVPMCPNAEINRIPMVIVDGNVFDASSRTAAHVYSITDGHIVSAMADDEILINPVVEAEIHQIERDANAYLSTILPDAPQLYFMLGAPDGWFIDDRPSWNARLNSDAVVSLRELSMAERYWAMVAIALAISRRGKSDVDLTVVCDEPESGLHRAAQEALPHALSTLAGTGNEATFLVTTHSAAILNAYEVEKLHIGKLDGSSSNVKSMDTSLTRAFNDSVVRSALDLSPADLLQLVRVFVFVEGQHDQAVLGHLLADDLRASNAVVIPKGGAKTLPSVVSARLLWDYTDPQVCVVMDNLARERLEPIWREAVDLAAEGKINAAKARLRELEGLPGGEPKWLRELLARSIDLGTFRRLHALPLTMPDVICYLPPDALGLPGTWDELLAEWRDGSPRPNDLKGWLDKRHNIKVGLGRIRRAVKFAVATREIQDLGLEIQGISTS
jgi:hypothetical protein